MSDLSDFLATECEGMTVQAAFNHARSQTVDVDGIAQSGYVMAYLAQAGKYTLLEDMSNNRDHALYADLSAVPGLTADYLYGVIKTAMQTLSTREGFDFRVPGVSDTMGLLVALGVLSTDDQAAIRAIGSKSEQRFVGLTTNQVVAIRNPELVAVTPIESAVSAPVQGPRNVGLGVSLMLNADAPAETALEVFLSTSVDGSIYGVWKYAGAVAVKEAGGYSIAINPQLTQAYTKVKLVSRAYNLDFTLGSVTAY